MKATTKQMINDFATKQVKDAEYKKTLAQRVYDANKDEIIEAGFYDIVEWTDDSMFSPMTKKMTVEITEAVNARDLAVMLLVDKNYYSPYLYLQWRKHEIKANYKF